jgi:hypothetical protein
MKLNFDDASVTEDKTMLLVIEWNIVKQLIKLINVF